MPSKDIRALYPLFLFLAIFVGCGIIFSYTPSGKGFYEISPNLAILPALLATFLIAKGSIKKRVTPLIKGLLDHNIILMGAIYCLAGIFSVTSAYIGGIEATVNLGINMIPSWFYLPGLFIVAALVATALGTSMGVIAALGPVAVAFSTKAGLSMPWCLGTIIGGAMFGDNLSLVSDTTIAALRTQGARLRDKFLMNAKIAIPAMLLCCTLLLLVPSTSTKLPQEPVYLIALLPYGVILIAGLFGINVIYTLILGILTSLSIAYFSSNNLSLDIFFDLVSIGIWAMHEILILSFLIGALSASINAQGGFDAALGKIKIFITWLPGHLGQSRLGQISIALIGSLADIVTANNTVAIILSGPLVRKLAQSYKISAARAATLLDTFSCVFQGILPYSAQILLASSISGISPLSLSLKVLYCPVLAVVTLVWVYFWRARESN